MKRCLLTIMLAVLTAFGLGAQTAEETYSEEVEYAGLEVQIDSSLYGRDIFSVLPADVTVMQPSAVREALNSMVEQNAGRMTGGFRIRIFLNSGREARDASTAAITRFNDKYPYIPAYRTYSAPNFKVSVGNLRTRVDAELLLRAVKADFPDAFIVRDRFRYPSLGSPDLRSMESEMSPEPLI